MNRDRLDILDNIYSFFFGQPQGYQIVNNGYNQVQERLRPCFVNPGSQYLDIQFNQRDSNFRNQKQDIFDTKINSYRQNIPLTINNTSQNEEFVSKFPDITKEKGGFTYTLESLPSPHISRPESPKVQYEDIKPPENTEKHLAQRLSAGQRSYDLGFDDLDSPPRPQVKFEPVKSENTRPVKQENTRRSQTSSRGRGGYVKTRGRGRGSKTYVKSERTAKSEQ